MIHTGLCSISFRELKPREIVDIVCQAALEGIEWGGDVHVCPGDTACAREVRDMTEDAGLRVASYGSYYRVAASEAEGVSFDSVLETAVALGAPDVRVWAGDCGSAEADEACRRQVVSETRRIADVAAREGVTVCYEFHGGSLADTNDSTKALLEEIGHENVRTYWQPALGQTVQYRIEGLEALLPWLANLHVFHWQGIEPRVRLPLADGEEEWMQYLSRTRSTGRNHYALMEFARDDRPELLLEDARVLKRWQEAVNGAGDTTI